MNETCAVCGCEIDSEDTSIVVRDDEGNALYTIHDYCEGYTDEENG